MRFFIGFTPIASGPYNLKKALEKLGHTVDTWVGQPHRFGYPYDFIVRDSNDILKIYEDYDVYVGFFGEMPFGSEYIKKLKAKGKKFVVIFNGCDIRKPKFMLGARFREPLMCEYCWSRKNCETIPKYEQKMDIALELADVIFCDIGVSDILIDGTVNTRDRQIHLMPQLIDFDDYKYQEKDDIKLKTIVHAPSDRSKKGTDFIIKAINEARDTGPLWLNILEGSHKDVVDGIKAADLAIDWLLLGWYGTFSVECMALGIPVLCYIHPVYETITGWRMPPTMKVDIDSLARHLRYLKKQPETLTQLARSQYRHVREHHDNVRFVENEFLPLLTGDKTIEEKENGYLEREILKT